MAESRLSDIPYKAYFTFSFPIRYRKRPNFLNADSSEWDEVYSLPSTIGLDGGHPFAKAYAAWCEQGVWVAFQVDYKGKLRPKPERFWDGDCCEVWIDTRGSYNAHKPTRYCHHIYMIPRGSQSLPIMGEVDYGKAKAEGDAMDLKEVKLSSRVTQGVYELEAFLPRDELVGYDPSESSNIGFCYNVCSPSLGRMHLSFQDGFRVFQDPSMWARCQLVRD